jgi:hypothetical protein
VKVESRKLADHVWLIGGGPMNSVLVEFKDFRCSCRSAAE